MQTERRVAANSQTKPTDLGCESADKWLLSIIVEHAGRWTNNSAMVWKLLRNVLQLPVNFFCSFEICCCYLCYRCVLFVYVFKITNGLKLKR